MSQENQSHLRFSLEESVWFQKGQEVAELVSISLDPNITIIENDQYVAIRGSLELTGEYKRFEDETTEQEEAISAPKFVQSVEEREEGIYEFLHRFPVDITIPNNRIQSVYDIDVTVDSFDYAVPERSCLKLVADLTISGLYGEQQNVPIEEEVPLDVPRNEAEEVAGINIDVEAARKEEESYSAQSKTEEVPELEPLYRSEHEENQEAPQMYTPNFILSNPIESHSNQLDDESGNFEYSKPFSAEAKRQPHIEESAEFAWGVPDPTQKKLIPKIPDFTLAANRSDVPPQEPEQALEPVYEMGGQDVVQKAIESGIEHEESSSSSPAQIGLLKKFTKKKSMSIAEFLGRKAENEQQAKLRVCIVQNGDTLDSLSRRYHLSVQQIVRVNHLEANQDVYEGQVLYIPETASS
ncbi:stage VI sporulation protein D [Neobacillus sp. LXY-4]|uniref:stage VI sporulation protein D n=1 Tax=Neobacillus sp. LXY-4 TaxID=3379826 RepID=UPI003EE2E734